LENAIVSTRGQSSLSCDKACSLIVCAARRRRLVPLPTRPSWQTRAWNWVEQHVSAKDTCTCACQGRYVQPVPSTWTPGKELSTKVDALTCMLSWSRECATDMIPEGGSLRSHSSRHSDSFLTRHALSLMPLIMLLVILQQEALPLRWRDHKDDTEFRTNS
jgi:hypothetical protein